MPCILKCGAIALLLTFLPICHAVLINRTIDSNLGDPVTNFIPIYRATPYEDEWDDETCIKCNINPDPAAAFDHTYMSSTYFPHNQSLEGINITLQFTGVAVWVFFILSNTNIHGNPFVSTHCNFTLDGQHAGNFSHEPDSTTYAFMYNVPVFSQTGLSNTPHQLIVSVNDFPIPTWVCFDYAVYTSQMDSANASTSSPVVTPSASGNSSTSATSQSTTTQTPKTGVIVGSIIGALALIAVLAFIRRRRSRKADNGHIHAFLNTSTTPASRAFLTASDSRRGPSSGSSQKRTLTAAYNGNNIPSSSGAPIPSSSDRRGERGLAMRQADMNYGSLSASHEAQQSSGTLVPVVQDIALLHGQIEELRNRMEQLQNQQQPGETLAPYGGQLSPPPYR